MCERCNNTGIVVSQREGVKYPYTCKECKKYTDIARYKLYDIMRETNPPITSFC